VHDGIQTRRASAARGGLSAGSDDFVIIPIRSSGMTREVLVVEDDRDIVSLLEMHLRDLGCQTTTAFDGRDGLEHALRRQWDLVILDLGLPGMDGMEICRRLRQTPPYTPILMLTARSSETERVVGLELGADDYVGKPFSIVEVMARIKALFRRVDALQTTGTAPEQIRCGALTIDSERREVRIDGRAIELTAKEFDLLAHFASSPGKVYTRAQLLDSVWGYSHSGYEHTVNSHINRLRSKIEPDPAQPQYIVTVWGVGYKFRAE
jgi:DNA-binding response OmpR family regulator